MQYKGVRYVLKFPWVDRLRLLFGGRFVIEVRVEAGDSLIDVEVMSTLVGQRSDIMIEV